MQTTDPTHPRAVLYARLATETPGELDAQLGELRVYAAAQGWTNVGEFSEVISGQQRHRPQLDAVLKMAHGREFDTLLVRDLARLSRSSVHFAEMVGLLESHQVRLASVQQPNFDFSVWRQIVPQSD